MKHKKILLYQLAQAELRVKRADILFKWALKEKIDSLGARCKIMDEAQEQNIHAKPRA